ncbi:MerR family transcriptional regulator [Nonomuraea sp. NBC_00507]|uniref:MerR family transcriptional regulator n=1 Tax=Nonomuraea sp. NBC_00507 TaxID=2976002 RepID=UPI002E1967A5
MDLIPIGEAARLVGMNASALRYYEERGLVTPVTRTGGRRMYGRQELRFLAFLRTMQQLGISLDTAGAVLHAPGEEWRKAAAEQIDVLEELIHRAKAAQWVLRHSIECPAEHPARECPTWIGMVDQLLEGYTLDQLAADHVTE